VKTGAILFVVLEGKILTPLLTIVSQIGCYAEAMESIPMNCGAGSTQDVQPLPIAYLS
jgi:hypothetical protein